MLLEDFLRRRRGMPTVAARGQQKSASRRFLGCPAGDAGAVCNGGRDAIALNKQVIDLMQKKRIHKSIGLAN
ncbi:MAG: hypothetical protein WCC51_03155 [Stenotrophomonas indicatrix]|uniref:hypothetical protein n=1 Tax=Stenotrophomonas indicatrix TaxID=2045451 RepID=UPI003C7CC2DE